MEFFADIISDVQDCYTEDYLQFFLLFVISEILFFFSRFRRTCRWVITHCISCDFVTKTFIKSYAPEFIALYRVEYLIRFRCFKQYYCLLNWGYTQATKKKKRGGKIRLIGVVYCVINLLGSFEETCRLTRLR